jgi:hypothetical protein
MISNKEFWKKNWYCIALGSVGKTAKVANGSNRAKGWNNELNSL